MGKTGFEVDFQLITSKFTFQRGFIYWWFRFLTNPNNRKAKPGLNSRHKTVLSYSHPVSQPVHHPILLHDLMVRLICKLKSFGFLQLVY